MSSVTVAGNPTTRASKRTLEATASSNEPAASAPKNVCFPQIHPNLPQPPANLHENDIQTTRLSEPAAAPIIISLLDTSDEEDATLNTDASVTPALVDEWTCDDGQVAILHTDANATPAPVDEWTCNACTLINDHLRSVCGACSAERPAEPTSSGQLLAELISLHNCQSIVGTVAAIECPVCLDRVPAFKGAVLSGCLHSFCRECLVQTVLHSEQSDVQCPFTSTEYSCASRMLDSEIRALLSDVQHAQYLDGSLREAERSAENAFHCKTLDCRGWCLYEHGEQPVRQFRCPVCEAINCISCDVIHKGRTCEEYKVSVRNAAEAEVQEGILKQGDVMQCPKCKVKCVF